MKVFKIVRRIADGTLWSFNPPPCVIGKENAASVCYTPGRITKPKAKGTPLYAFDCLGAARQLLSSTYLRGYEIWECEATRAYSLLSVERLAKRRGFFLLHGPAAASACQLKRQWRGWELVAIRAKEKTRILPYGMVLCEAIKLIRPCRY